MVLPVLAEVKRFISSPQPATLHLLESLLVQVVNVQRFTPVAQDLLLLLSLRLPFAAALFGLRASWKGSGPRVLDA